MPDIAHHSLCQCRTHAIRTYMSVLESAQDGTSSALSASFAGVPFAAWTLCQYRTLGSARAGG
eukprot:809356-Rhodomonas_salina.1